MVKNNIHQDKWNFAYTEKPALVVADGPANWKKDIPDITLNGMLVTLLFQTAMIQCMEVRTNVISC